jgi:hypothetical protein
MKKATEIFKEQISECELKFTQKERLIITSMIKKAQIDAIDEAIDKCFNDTIIVIYSPYFINQIKAGIDKSKIIKLGNKLKDEL